VPAKIIADWITAIDKSFENYNANLGAYNTFKADYNVYVNAWNEKYAELEEDWGLDTALTWYFGTGLFGIQETMKPPVPVLPNAYTGPSMYSGSGTTLNFLQREETWGLGLLTADVIPSSFPTGKIFGVLGSGEDMTLGAKFAKELPGSCTTSTQIVTLIPKADCGASCTKNTNIIASSNDWGFHLTAPTTPSAATAFETKKELNST
jgi:hypothetical protein